MVRFTIDGRKAEAESGKTILETARAMSINIPTLCYHKALVPHAGCRLCLVEIAGRDELQASCAYPVENGIEVMTSSPRVARARRLVAELLYLRCPEVPRIQELAREFGIDTDRLKERFTPDNEKCILCDLCVRICKERMKVNAFDYINRGHLRKWSTPYRQPSPFCLACGACQSVCPLGSVDLSEITLHKPRPILSEYDAGLTRRGPIHIPFAQAIPKVPVIDRDHCIYFQRGVCKTCEAFCEAGAINHDQKDEIERIEVGAVVLAAGYEAIDPQIRAELGYGRYANVVSSLQFERLLSASGPHMGKVLRPSDLTPPRRIAFVQCVGSREVDHNYCSSVCCMYATKEALIVKEHAPETECTIFYIDLRAFGKGYEAYYRRAKEEGVRYIRCHPSAVREVHGSKNLVLQFPSEDGSIVKEEFDLVVLAVGTRPAPDAAGLAGAFGLRLDARGFVQTHELAPVETSRSGVYVAGVLGGPKDIPESVMEASAAAAKAMSFLAPARGTLVGEMSYPPERDVAGEEPRIGVFVCHCGRNIAGVVDVPQAVEYARTLPGVVYAEDNMYTCSTDTQQRIKQKIDEHRLNRVIVASCTPRTHEPLFRNTIREAGLNPYLLEMANIRDQCSWVHMHEPVKATRKAKDLIRMAVVKSALLEPLYSASVEVNPRCVVLGGGLAGMTAALELARQGFEAHLLEKSDALGGNLRSVKFLLNGVDPQERLRDLVSRVSSHPRVRVYNKAELVDFEGSAGNFLTRFRADGHLYEIQHGALIVATGAAEHRPSEYLYGQHPAVVTQLELEERLARGNFQAASVAMVQCVGACEEEHGYCSRLCCAQAIKTALKIKERSPDTAIFILHRDMRTYGFYEASYREARERGVRFIRMAEGTRPEVAASNGRVTLSVTDDILKGRLGLETDMLVLSTGIDPGEGNRELAQVLKVPLNQDGFFLEAHMKLRPVDSAT
ncbi:MAG: FAD-dependent oxidoreductase, partial [Chloroflexi bacterium]|nr:FAD-dependent oxidoreductase [Chloroflexota bacterium]